MPGAIDYLRKIKAGAAEGKQKILDNNKNSESAFGEFGNKIRKAEIGALGAVGGAVQAAVTKK